MDIQRFKELTLRVLEITDDLDIHREAVAIPLSVEGDGDVRMLTPNRLEIVGPEGNLDDFIDGLQARLEQLDLSTLPRA